MLQSYYLTEDTMQLGAVRKSLLWFGVFTATLIPSAEVFDSMTQRDVTEKRQNRNRPSNDDVLLSLVHRTEYLEEKIEQAYI